MLLLLLVLSSCSIQEEKPNRVEYNRWDISENNSDLGEFNERGSRVYSTELSYDNGHFSNGLNLCTYSNSEEILNNGEGDIKSILEKVKTLGDFVEFVPKMYELFAMWYSKSSDKAKQFSVNYYIDGKVQVLYHIEWNSQDTVIPESKEIAKDIEKYTGIKVSESNLISLYSGIYSNGVEGGEYTYSVEDPNKYCYYAVSVSNLKTPVEKWEIYSSKTVGI